MDRGCLRRGASIVLGGWLALAASTPGVAQEIRFEDGSSLGTHAQRVELEPDTLVVTAGKPGWIQLRFRVLPGYHINSHTPKDELLIRTELKLSPQSHLRVLHDAYPEGEPLHLSIGSGETVSTYQGEFRIRLEVIADRGASRLSGQLHYQACNTDSCFPPRDLPVDLPLTAR